MKRLLRISLDTLVISLTPIIGWFLLGIFIDVNLVQTFSLVYPLQFVVNIIKSLFGTGANISAVRDKNKDRVFSGILLGIIIGGFIFGSVAFNIEKYIKFMNMDVNIYKIFAIYAVIQLYLQLILNLVLLNMYYENKNKTANKYSIIFNLVNFGTLIFSSIITKNQVIITSVSIFATTLFVIIMLIKFVKITKIKIDIKNCIKYDSVNLFASISMFIIYLFGFKNAFDFGAKYALAISFATLITDTQWDMSHSIVTVAQIDIAHRKFIYKNHIRNSYKLIGLLIISTIIMGILLYPKYRVDITATLIVTLNELLCLSLYPIYITRLIYIQLEDSAVKATVAKQIANILRVLTSFIYSPYCTSIGLLVSVIFQILSTKFILIKDKLDIKKELEKSEFN